MAKMILQKTNNRHTYNQVSNKETLGMSLQIWVTLDFRKWKYLKVRLEKYLDTTKIKASMLKH